MPSVAAFSERYWRRPRTEEYLRWRYLDSRPFSRLFLALADQECLGMVYGFEKTYVIAGDLVPCLEIFDWHSLPGLKGSGVGLRVMRAAMREGKRLVGIGGTADVLKALPAMGWQTLGSAMNFELPLSSDVLEESLRARLSVRIPGERFALRAAATFFRPRRVRGRLRLVPVGALGPEIDELYNPSGGYDFVQQPNRTIQRWLTAGYSGVGSFQCWHAVEEQRVVGWVLTRLYDTSNGLEASVVDAFLEKPTVDAYAELIAQASAPLAAARPRVIRARASCPVLQAALRSNRFRPGTPAAIFTWPKMPCLPERVHMTLNHTDASLRPYVVRPADGDVDSSQ